MRLRFIIGFTALVLIAGIVAMEAGERALAAAAFLGLSATVVWLYRRFRRAGDALPPVFHAAAATGLALGTLTVIVGVLHSAAVTAVAFREGAWVPLTILRFTTGLMLVFAGAMNLAVHGAIRDGHAWAVRVNVATSLLFWSYLCLLFPLAGTGGTVPPTLAMWSAYLIWLCAAHLHASRVS